MGPRLRRDATDLYVYGPTYVRCDDCSLVRRFYSPKVRKSEIKGSSFRRFMSPKVRKSDNDTDSFEYIVLQK